MNTAKKLMMMMRGSGSAEINTVAPAITPTLGANVFLNPGFETAGGGGADVFADWGETVVSTSTVNDETTDVHSGAHAVRLDINASNSNAQVAQAALTSGKWYLFSVWAKASAGTPTLGFGLSPYCVATLSTTYQQFVGSQKGGVTSAILRQTAPSTSLYVDDVTAQEAVFSTTHVRLGARSVRAGTYTCTPTVALNTQAGIMVAYTDDNNFVMVVVDRTFANAVMYTRIAGTWAMPTYGPITYVDGRTLGVMTDGAGHYSMYYNNVQVGTTQTVVETTLGLEVHAFTPFASNAVGVVTTNSNFS